MKGREAGGNKQKVRICLLNLPPQSWDSCASETAVSHLDSLLHMLADVPLVRMPCREELTT